MPYEAVLSDAIKIIGPAAIAAYVSYRVAKIQIDQKLKEISLSQEFNVRKIIFDMYVKKLDAIHNQSEELNKFLGHALGFLTGVGDIGKESFANVTKTYIETLRYSSEDAKKSLELTKAEMEKNKLIAEYSYSEIPMHLDNINRMIFEDDLESIRSNIFLLLSAYSCLKHCTEALVEKEKDTIFEKYLSSKQSIGSSLPMEKNGKQGETES